MAKKMFRIEIDIPDSVSVTHFRNDLKDFMKDAAEYYESYSDKKLSKPVVRKLKQATMVTPDKYYYE